MQKPYFLDQRMPHIVRKYMDEMHEVDVDVITSKILENEKPHAKEKALRLSVRSAVEWNNYLISKEDKKKKPKEIPMETTPSKSTTEKEKTVKTKKSSNGSASIEEEIEKSLINAKKPETVFTDNLETIAPADYICDASVEESIKFVVSEFVRKSKPSINVLVSGPEKSGKTTLTLLIKQILDVEMVVVDLDEIFRAGLMKSPVKKFQDALTKIHTQMPGIVFIHNLERLFPNKETNSRSHEQDLSSIVHLLLNFIQSISKDGDFENLMIIGESSKPELLESSLSNSFRYRIRIPPPSANERHKLVEYFCRNEKLKDDVDLKKIALRASGYVADDLKNLVFEATLSANFRVYKSLGLNNVSLAGLALSLKDQNKEENETFLESEDFANGLKKITPSLKRHGFPSIPDTTWEDIGGLKKVKEELRDVLIEPILHPQLQKMFGLQQKSGVLLWGPPGCGKTLLAKAVANEAGVNLLVVNGPELLSMYQGESERAVRVVFARAASVAPCVIFFDEFDSLCPARSRIGDSGSKSTIVNMLLTEMDGFISRDGIYLMAATNLPSILDPAALRPGRFDRKLYVDFPSASDRVAIMETSTKNNSSVVLAPCVDLSEIASREECEHFTGADCHNLVQLAKRISLKEYSDQMKSQEDDVKSKQENGSVKRSAADLDSSSEASSQVSKKQKSETGAVEAKAQDEDLTKGVLTKKHFEEALLQIQPSVSIMQRKIYQEQQKQLL